MAPKIKIYQIYFDEKSKARIDPLTIPYDNSNTDTIKPCLENHVIRSLVEHRQHLDCDYFGVLSWAFENKNPLKIKYIYDLVDGSFDVYSFYGLHTSDNVWKVAERWHKGIIDMAQHVFNKLNMDVNVKTIVTPTVYQNAFLTTPIIYERYVNEMLIPFMDMLLSDKEIQARVNSDTRYKHGEFNKSKMEKVTGKPHYTFHTFICERLFSTFLAMNPYYKIKHLS